MMIHFFNTFYQEEDALFEVRGVFEVEFVEPVLEGFIREAEYFSRFGNDPVAFFHRFYQELFFKLFHRKTFEGEVKINFA